MDFALLPPEVNSTLMYSGPGSGPMLIAANGWRALAQELYSTAGSYRSLLSAIAAGPWLGPAATAMSAATAPFLTWLSTTATLVEQAGMKAASAASAYEAAFSGTVPPIAVAVNRERLVDLVLTNVFAQNTPAIALTEAEYQEMWAQDATAMYSYADAAADAMDLPDFTPPQMTTGPSAADTECPPAVNRLDPTATGNASAPQPMVSQASPTPTRTASGPSGIVVPGVLGQMLKGVTGSSTLDASSPFNTYIRLISPIRLTTTAIKDMDGLAHSLFPAAAVAAEGAATVPAAAAAADGAAQVIGGGSSGIGSSTGMGNGLAGIGKAAHLGGLSVPNAWASGTAGLGRAATLPLHGAGAGAAVIPAANDRLFGGLPLAGGRGDKRGLVDAPRYGFHPTVMTRPPSAG